MSNQNIFTKEEEIQICREYQAMEKPSIAAVARRWDTYPKKIKNILNHNGVDIITNYLSTEQKQEIIKDYIENKISMKAVGDKYGISAASVCLILKEYGVKARDYHEAGMIYAFNELVFDEPNNPKANYWKGFIMGDGSIVNNRLSCELAEDDKEHLYLLREFLQSNHPVKVYDSRKEGWKTTAKIEIHSQHLVNTLADYGIIQGKSIKNVGAKKDLAKSPDFWRGLVDADGSVLIITRGEYTYPSLSLCGTETLMNQFLEFVRIHTDTKSKPHKGKGNYLWRVKLDGKPARKIIKLLYDGEEKTALERKKQVAKEIISKFPPVDEAEEQKQYFNFLKQGISRMGSLKSIGRSYNTLEKWLKSNDFAKKEWEILNNFEDSQIRIRKHPFVTFTKDN